MKDEDMFYLKPTVTVKDFLRFAIEGPTLAHPDGKPFTHKFETHKFEWTTNTTTAAEVTLRGES